MKRQRYYLPSEGPVIVGWRAWWGSGGPLLVAMAGPPVLAYLWHGYAMGHWGGSLIGVVIALGFAAVFWHGLVTRFTQCNSSIYRRAERPVRYWLTLGVWLAGYALGVGSLLWGSFQS